MKDFFGKAAREDSGKPAFTPPVFGKSGSYRPILFTILGFLLLLWLTVPNHYFERHWMALILAFVFGLLVGLTEVASRYRDEPLLAVLSPFGQVYVFLNGAISICCALLIFRFRTSFPGVGGDELLTALAAGFGSAVVMRARVAIVKDADNKDVSIGPDLVIKAMLAMCDLAIDRYRATKRGELVLRHLPAMRALGDVFPQVTGSRFAKASNYLIVSLYSLQNPDVELKKQLIQVQQTNDQESNMPEDLKFFAFGYFFLNLVGETLFQSVLTNAQEAIKKNVLGGTPIVAATGPAAVAAAATVGASASTHSPLLPPVPLEIATLVANPDRTVQVTHATVGGDRATTMELQYQLPGEADFGHTISVMRPFQTVGPFAAGITVIFRNRLSNTSPEVVFSQTKSIAIAA